jgi:hypothetical protein
MKTWGQTRLIRNEEVNEGIIKEELYLTILTCLNIFRKSCEQKTERPGNQRWLHLPTLRRWKG